MNVSWITQFQGLDDIKAWKLTEIILVWNILEKEQAKPVINESIMGNDKISVGRASSRHRCPTAKAVMSPETQIKYQAARR